MVESILLGLLGTFLNYWFQKWLKSKFGDKSLPSPIPISPPSQDDLKTSKPEFLAELRFHESLGPMRMTIAERLFDKAVQRYTPPTQAAADAAQKRDFSDVVKTMIQGIRSDVN